jgi:hypothetical protein
VKYILGRLDSLNLGTTSFVKCLFSSYLTGAFPNPKSKAHKTGALLKYKDARLSSELVADSSFDEQGTVPKHMNTHGRSRKSEPIPSNLRDDDDDDDDGDDGIENDSDREESK